MVLLRVVRGCTRHHQNIVGVPGLASSSNSGGRVGSTGVVGNIPVAFPGMPFCMEIYGRKKMKIEMEELPEYSLILLVVVMIEIDGGEIEGREEREESGQTRV